jgi:hypothetical protein
MSRSSGIDLAIIGNGRVAIALSGSRWILDRLLDYFHPWLSEVTGDSPCALVRMHVGGSAICGTLRPDGRVERLRNENTGRVWYADRYQAADRTVFMLDDAVTAVSYTGRGGALDVSAATQDTLFWAAKDIIQRQILQPIMQQRSTIMHAAGVAINGKVLAITGAKGAGKTTVQFTLASSGAALLSADRIYLGVDDQKSKCLAWGYPARSSVDRDSFRLFPELGTTDGFGADGSAKVLVPLGELARRFHTSVQPRGPVGAVLFCRRAKTRGLLSRVHPDKVPALLADSWFQMYDPIVPSWLPLFAVSRQTRRRAMCEVLCALRASVPVLQVSSEAVRDSGPSITRSTIERLLDDCDR